MFSSTCLTFLPSLSRKMHIKNQISLKGYREFCLQKKLSRHIRNMHQTSPAVGNLALALPSLVRIYVCEHRSEKAESVRLCGNHLAELYMDSKRKLLMADYI